MALLYDNLITNVGYITICIKHVSQLWASPVPSCLDNRGFTVYCFDNYWAMQYSSYIITFSLVICRDLKTDLNSHKHQFLSIFSLQISCGCLYNYYSTVLCMHLLYILCTPLPHMLVQQQSTILTFTYMILWFSFVPRLLPPAWWSGYCYKDILESDIF